MKYLPLEFSWRLSGLFFMMCISIVLSSSTLNAQDETDIISPSPDVASLMKFSEIPVNYYTGVPSINIPLHTINERDISVPISLVYHSSGIRVNEEASWVGLGWALQAGGVISRTIIGQDDLEDTYLEDPNVPNITSPISNSVSPYVYVGCNEVVNGINLCDYLGRYVSNSSSTIPIPYDFEPDQFTFSLPGKNGKFILNRNGEVILQDQEKISVRYIAAGSQWEINDDAGFIYRYRDKETVTEQGDFTEVTTAWYLGEIESPKGNKVTFTYTKDTVENRYTIGDIVETRSVSYCADDINNLSLPVERTYRGVSLTTIDFTTGQIRLDYSRDRLDQEGGKKLNNIALYTKNSDSTVAAEALKQFAFNYEYFEGNSENILRYPNVTDTRQITDRLKLVSVTEESINDSKPPYQFSYYESGDLGATTSSLPSKASFAQDYWGYYNGRNGSNHIAPQLNMVVNFNGQNRNVMLEGQDRTVVPEASRAFALKEMIYPTGGSTEFLYESNDYDLSSSQPLQESMFPGSGPVQLNPDNENAPGFKGQTTITALDLTNAYVNPNDGKVHVTYVATFRCFEEPGGCQTPFEDTGDVYFELHTNSSATNPVAVSAGISRVDFTEGTFCYDPDILVCERQPFELLLDPTVYYVKAQWDNTVNLTGINAQYSWQYEDNDQVDETASDGLAGGLRIAQIINKPLNGNDIIKRYVYNYAEDRDADGTDEKYSYGKLMDFPYHYRYQTDIDYNLLRQGVSEYCSSFIQSSTSNTPLGIHGYTVGYDQVTEYTGSESVDEGKTIYEYINRIQTIPYAEFRLPGIPNAIASSNGLLEKQTDYKYISSDVFRMVREIENKYIIDTIDYNSPPTASSSSELIYGVKKRIPSFDSYSCDPGEPCPPQNPSPELVELFFYPAIHSEWVRQNTRTERIYHQENEAQLVETTTSFEYESTPVHYQLKQQSTTDSEGRLRQTSFTYPADAGSGAPAVMWDENDPDYRHMHRQIVDQVTRVADDTTQRTITTYSEESGNVVPTVVQIFPRGKGEDIQVNYGYDQHGNINQVQKENDLATAYLWGYNHTLPVAKVVGVVYDTTQVPIDLAALQNLTGQALRDELNALRSLPDALVTTYTYDPLRGMTSQTGPDGITSYFEYDALGRLRLIRDQQSDIVGKYEYHYAPTDSQ